MIRTRSSPVGRPALRVLHCVVVGLLQWPATSAAQAPADDLRRLSLEQLLQVEISTVSRVPEPLGRASAAVTVITQEDIRRSGATTLVEALRLAPGVHVAQIDANKWAVGVRGFTDRLSRAMLVMIDGRAVYSPLFAGTYWEMQDTLLDDVERIEVVRGPGGTLWGANAVNGIINVITKSSEATQGGLVTGGGGSHEQGFVGVRYGGRRGVNQAYRAYAKAFDRAPGFHADGNGFDSWDGGQAGFRTDTTLASGGSLTVQGDLYAGRAGQRLTVTTYTPPFARTLNDETKLFGANLLARWRTPVGKRSTASLQAYYDRTDRTEAAFDETHDTVDLDFQHAYTKLGRHSPIWGVGYRMVADDTAAIPIRGFEPAGRTRHLFSGFVKDQIELVKDGLQVAGGIKLEHNFYSGFEAQPSARILWTPAVNQSVVLSVTNAVRTPSRVEEDYVTGSVLNPSVPFFLRLDPNDDFETEKLTAYEAGYRIQVAQRVGLTVATFFNHHRDTLSTVAGPVFAESQPAPAHLILPVQFANGLHGNSHGIEITSDVRLAPWCQWTAAYSGLRIQLTRDPGEVDLSQEFRNEGSSPRHQFISRVSLDLPGQLELDWMLRDVGALPSVAVPAYATSDVRLAWNPNGRVSLAVVGKNLHAPRHLEFYGGTAGNVDVPRSVYGKVAWRW